MSADSSYDQARFAAIHEINAYSNLQECSGAKKYLDSEKIPGLRLICVPKRHLW